MGMRLVYEAAEDPAGQEGDLAPGTVEGFSTVQRREGRPGPSVCLAARTQRRISRRGWVQVATATLHQADQEPSRQ